jgi:hypothetical protein
MPPRLPPVCVMRSSTDAGPVREGSVPVTVPPLAWKVVDVAEKVVLQRTCSPPDTAILFISIIGDLPAPEFKKRWRSLVAKDKILSFYMSQMKEATVLRGLSDGTVLEQESLFADEKPA